MSSSLQARVLLVSLAAIALLISCRGAAPPPPPVYDTDGHELRAGSNYHVLQAIPDRGGGGLTLAPHGGRRCPLFVAQDANREHPGLPVRFAPHGGAGGSADPTVRVSTDVRVSFRADTACAQSTEWHVEAASGGKKIKPDLGGRRHVVTGPVVGESPSGREKAFRVESERGATDEEHEYRLTWCGDEAACQALGVFRDGEGGAWFLGTGPLSHVVVFQKAPSV